MYEWEFYLGDSDYNGEPKSFEYFRDEDTRCKRLIIYRVNGRIKKQWGCLERPWKHGTAIHHEIVI